MSASGKNIATSTYPNKPTILVVDDDSGVRESLCEALGDAEFNTLTAINGSDALQCLGMLDRMPTAIVLDIMMPIMDGWKFLAHRQDDPALSAIPVVILSANATIPNLTGWAGHVTYLRKPIDLDPLLQCIRDVCAVSA